MEVQACRVCLSTETHLLSVAENIDMTAFEDVVGYKINLENSVLKHICNPCKADIHRYAEFKKRCCYVQLQLDAKIADGVLITKDFMESINKTFKPRNLAITEVLKYSIDGLPLENIGRKSFVTEIKIEYDSESNPAQTYEYEDLSDNTDLATLKLEKTKYETQEHKPEINDEVFEERKILEHKTAKRVSKKDTNSKSRPIKKQKKELKDEIVLKVEKANKVVKNNITSKSKRKPLNKVNWNKRMTEQSLKKYNMKLKILTREEQIEKMLERQQSEKYKHARLKCELCYKPYTSEKAFENHNKLHRPSPLRPVKCELCQVFLSRSTIRDHARLHRKELICLQCGEGVSTVQMKNHHDFHAGVKFECKECRKTYHHKSTYMSHLRARHADVVCALCADVFFGQQGIFVHVKKSHLEEAKEQCETCKHYFSSSEALQRHLDSCSKDVSPCGRCGLACDDAAALGAHLAAEHRAPRPAPSGPLVCTQCNSRFRMEAALMAHWRSKHRAGAERQLEAAKAQKSKHVCEQCGAMLMSSCHLRMHMMKHTGEKPHQCDVCHKSFRLLTTLKSHMMVHSGEKPFQCTECPNAYRQKSHLKIHMRTHTGEKPYACDMCQKAFACKGNRDEHARTVHGGLPPKRRLAGRRGKQPAVY